MFIKLNCAGQFRAIFVCYIEAFSVFKKKYSFDSILALKICTQVGCEFARVLYSNIRVNFKQISMETKNKNHVLTHCFCRFIEYIFSYYNILLQ